MWRTEEEILNAFNDKERQSVILAQYFRENDLGGFGGELPENLADIIAYIRSGIYDFEQQPRAYTRINRAGLTEMNLCVEEVIELVKTEEFLEHVVEACKRKFPSDSHAPSFIYSALLIWQKTKKSIK